MTKKPPSKADWKELSIRTHANAIKDKVKNLKAKDVSKFARNLMKESKHGMSYERAIKTIEKAMHLIPHPAGKIAAKATPLILKGGKKAVERYDKYMKKRKLEKKRKHRAQSEITRGKETNIIALEFPGRGKVIKKYGGPVRKAKYKD